MDPIRCKRRGRLPSGRPIPFGNACAKRQFRRQHEANKLVYLADRNRLSRGLRHGAEPTGSIQGLVTDKTGAAVQGATITIVRTSTNETRNTTTDSGGRYLIPFVQPGNYTVTVDGKGFRSAKQENILVQVSETRPVDFKLDVGTVSETIQVNATTENLSVDTSSLGQTVQSETVLQLPDNGRNVFDFALLVPGVTNGVPGSSEASASTPHIGGSRNGNNEQMIDGMTNILPENNVGNNSSAYMPVEDSVQELNVQTSVLPAEAGRFSGGVISLITKSGGNQWHGSFFEFLQQGSLDAVPFGTPGKTNATGTKPDMPQHQTGGTVTGPIIKNRAFFFFDYEDSRAHTLSNPKLCPVSQTSITAADDGRGINTIG